MPSTFITWLRPLATVALLALSAQQLAAQQSTPSRIRGTVASLDGDTLAVTSRSGEQVKLHIASDLRVAGIAPIALSEIKPGSFIGATTVPGPDGAHDAVEIHVFPEAMRGTGEGSRPWDLKPNSTMTNATVDQSVASNDGHTLHVKYKDGEKIITLTPQTAIVTYVPADRSDLKPGAKIIAQVKPLPDGTLETARISVGQNGLTPPM
jgi:hypothetical protein